MFSCARNGYVQSTVEEIIHSSNTSTEGHSKYFLMKGVNMLKIYVWKLFSGKVRGVISVKQPYRNTYQMIFMKFSGQVRNDTNILRSLFGTGFFGGESISGSNITEKSIILRTGQTWHKNQFIKLGLGLGAISCLASLFHVPQTRNGRGLFYQNCILFVYGLMGIPLSNLIFIPPASTKLKGGYSGFTLSICPSVHLWTKSCSLSIFNNTHQIHFIFAHLIKQLQKVCHV